MNPLRLENLHGGPFALICAFSGRPQVLEETSQSLRKLTQEEGYNEFLKLIVQTEELFERCNISKNEIQKALQYPGRTPEKIKHTFQKIESALISKNYPYLPPSKPLEANWEQITELAHEIREKKGEILIEFFRTLAPQHPPMVEYLKKMGEYSFDLDPRLRKAHIVKQAEEISSWLKTNQATFTQPLNLEELYFFPKEICLLHLEEWQMKFIFLDSIESGNLETLESILEDPQFSANIQDTIEEAVCDAAFEGYPPILSLLLEKFSPQISQACFSRAFGKTAGGGHLSCIAVFQRQNSHPIPWAQGLTKALKAGRLEFAKAIFSQTQNTLKEVKWVDALKTTALINHHQTLDFILKNSPYSFGPDFLQDLIVLAQERDNRECVEILNVAFHRAKCRETSLKVCAFFLTMSATSFLAWAAIHKVQN